VIAGAAKGRRLRTLRGTATRPTTDQARTTIFDVLGSLVDGARVLDLFAGSGALGIEALSRGAAECVFVEQSREACSVILANLEATAMRGRAVIRRADAVRWLSRRAATPFDLVFLDPPYGLGLPFVGRILGRLAGHGWVRPGGTVVAEAETGDVPWPPGFRETRTRRFGRTQVSMAVWGHAQRADRDLPGDV
jgi:16S rRNA (guanine966-N2)-methyltransferase